MFKIRSDIFLEGLIVKKKSKKRGYLEGELVVKEDISFTFLGWISGNVNIEKGAKVRIYGRVSGNIDNKGELQIYGEHTGILHDNEGVTKYEYRVIED